MGWIQDGVPVVGKENPGGEQKTVSLPAGADHLGQAVKLRLGELLPTPQESARDEEETIRQHEATQAPQKPQSLKNANSALPASAVHGKET